MHLTDFPNELLIQILVHLDARSICRFFQVHPNFSGLMNDEYLWRQLCQQHLHQSVIDGTYRKYYCQHVKIFTSLWCTGRVVQISQGHQIHRNRIMPSRHPLQVDMSIPHPCFARIYQSTGHFGFPTRTTIRYEFGKWDPISQAQAQHFITELYPKNELSYELQVNSYAANEVTSSIRSRLQIMEWTHRHIEPGSWDPIWIE